MQTNKCNSPDGLKDTHHITFTVETEEAFSKVQYFFVIIVLKKPVVKKNTL